MLVFNVLIILGFLHFPSTWGWYLFAEILLWSCYIHTYYFHACLAISRPLLQEMNVTNLERSYKTHAENVIIIALNKNIRLNRLTINF